MVNVCVQHFDIYYVPKSKLTNANILCLVWFGSGRNKLVQLLIRSRNSGDQTIRSLVKTGNSLRKNFAAGSVYCLYSYNLTAGQKCAYCYHYYNYY